MCVPSPTCTYGNCTTPLVVCYHTVSIPHYIRHSSPPSLSLSAGIIRSLACAENWIAVGNYNGMINALDFRTGELLGNWKPSEFAPMQVSNECQVN